MIPPLAIGAGIGVLVLALLRRKMARGGASNTGWQGSDYTRYGYPGYRGGMGPGPGYGPWGAYGSPGYSEMGYGHGYYINRYATTGVTPFGYGATPPVAMPDTLQGVRNLAATYLGNLQASNEFPGPSKDALMHQLSMIADPTSTMASITSTLAAMRASGNAQASLASDLQAQLH